MIEPTATSAASHSGPSTSGSGRLARFARLALVASAIAATLSGCGDSGSMPAETGSVYRHSMDGAPSTLDPAQAATIYSSVVVVNVFDTLYRYKYLARPYELAPNLAIDFPEVSDDGLAYIFRIRDDARFGDDPAFPEGTGRPVTVHDLVYSLKRHFDPSQRSQGAWLWSDRIRGLDAWGENGADYDKPVEGLEAVDDHTLKIKLTKPYPQLVYTLATGFSALVPREAVEHYGREFGVKPVGSGPYQLVSFDNTLARLERNPNFRREPLDLATEGFDPVMHGDLGLASLDGRAYPFTERLEIHFIQENAARWSAFSSGEVDNVMVPNEQVESVLSNRDPIEFRPAISARYHGNAGLEAGFVYAGFNMADERYGHHPDPERDVANRALRCAIRDAFDWQARNDTFYYGIGKIFPGVIPPVVPEFDPDRSRASVQSDLDGAKALLAEHGWTPDRLPELTYGLVTGVQQRQMYAQLRGQMVELGFPMEKIQADTFASFGDFSRAMKNRRLDLFFLGWTLDYPDAQNTLQLFYGPYETPGSNNFNYRNPEFDALYEQAATMQPGPERTALYRRMNGMVIDDCVAISGLSRTRIHLWNKDVAMLPDREILGGFFMRFVDVARSDGGG
ncbi:MAG TPA: ABC transporter substrate-binding protein [Wenzhouxiangellaceae bacterium]|nr:ABC transporter substrate-binding protein [Wenzhouxiangellaceae bacterium]